MPNKPVARVILIRHGESIWNITDYARDLTLRFTGWADVRLTDIGKAQAAAAGRCLKRFGIIPNVVYTSLLQRSKATLDIALNAAELNSDKLTIVHSWRLNERHYGGLAGLSKDEAIKLNGRELVMGWRRSWDLRPPPVDPNDKEDWRHLITVQPTTIVNSKGNISWNIEKNVKIPDTESLEDCANRAVVLWNSSIAPRLLLGQTVMIIAHANTIRALVKMIDGDCMTLKDIKEVMIPSAVPLVYQFNKDLHPVQEPTMLGMRGRYLLSHELILRSEILKKRKTTPNEKEVVFLSQQSNIMTKFIGLVEENYENVKSFCDSGLGRYVPVAVTSYRGKYVYVNSKWTQTTGYLPTDIIGKSWKHMHGPMTARQSISEINSRLHSGLATDSTITEYHKDGKAYDTSVSIIPIYDWLHTMIEQTLNDQNMSDRQYTNYDPLYDSTHVRTHMIPSHYVIIVKSITYRPDITPLGGTFSPIQVDAKYLKSFYGKAGDEDDDQPLDDITQHSDAFSVTPVVGSSAYSSSHLSPVELSAQYLKMINAKPPDEQYDRVD